MTKLLFKLSIFSSFFYYTLFFLNSFLFPFVSFFLSIFLSPFFAKLSLMPTWLCLNPCAPHYMHPYVHAYGCALSVTCWQDYDDDCCDVAEWILIPLLQLSWGTMAIATRSLWIPSKFFSTMLISLFLWKGCRLRGSSLFDVGKGVGVCGYGCC